MARTAYPTLYNPNDRHLGLPENEFGLLSAFYDNAAPTLESLRTIGVLDKHVLWINDAGELWPDYYAHLPENNAPVDARCFRHIPTARAATACSSPTFSGRQSTAERFRYSSNIVRRAWSSTPEAKPSVSKRRRATAGRSRSVREKRSCSAVAVSRPIPSCA